jgi:hypothetical protein
MSPILPSALRDTVIGVLVIVVGAAVLAFANLPARVLVIESTQTKIEKTMERMDNKIDLLIERAHK